MRFRLFFVMLFAFVPVTVWGQGSVTSIDHKQGPETAPITLIEYGDYTCPYCKKLHPTLKSIRSHYGDAVQIVFRHFPLSNHKYGAVSSYASECVAREYGEEAFWTYHNFLYEQAWSYKENLLLAYATQLGFAGTALEACMDDDDIKKRVNKDKESGRASGVSGTPNTFLINNVTGTSQRIVGAVALDQWQSLIDKQLSTLESFTDVNSTSELGKALHFLSDKNIIAGNPDGTYAPSRPLNRAEIAKILLIARFGEVTSEEYKNTFHDVSKNDWFAAYVPLAVEQGIITGDPDGNFRPGDPVNTAELLALLGRTFQIEVETEGSYEDVPSDSWFYSYSTLASQFNLFPNRSKRYLLPNQAISRGEGAIALRRIMEHVPQ